MSRIVKALQGYLFVQSSFDPHCNDINTDLNSVLLSAAAFSNQCPAVCGLFLLLGSAGLEVHVPRLPLAARSADPDFTREYLAEDIVCSSCL